MTEIGTNKCVILHKFVRKSVLKESKIIDFQYFIK